jgi:hypothetical protein
MMPLNYVLTKGKYCKGLQCLKMLYAEENQEEEDVDPELELQLRQGLEVLEAARAQFPDGVLIDHAPWGSVLERTQNEIESGTPIIFEATFLYDDVLVRLDVLHRVGENLFDIIEVKSGTSMKDEHIPDVAVQRYVLEGDGFGVNKTFLMHLNSDYVHPDKGDLFEIEDCTDDVLIILPDVRGHVKTQKEILEKNKEPAIDIGPHCAGPYDCELEEECWDEIPKISIFNIPRLRWTKRWDLFGKNIILLEDLPSNYKLNVKQNRFVQSALNNRSYFDKKEIKRELDSLSEPIYFLDFETMNWAIPRYSNSSPYNQIPFQWSLHILKDGKLDHLEFLAVNPEDPRPKLTQELVDNIGDFGPIVAYHASFEGGILKSLASLYPDTQDKLLKMVDRLWDLEKIFLNHYIDHNFQGRTSIKMVLPVIVPSLSYDDLDIGDGGSAQAGWVKMLESEGFEKEKLRCALLEYCKMDTMAMVEIYRNLKEKTV